MVVETPFSLSRDLARQHDQRVMRLYGWEHLMVSNHPATFDDHGYCGIGDIAVLVCHVILQAHVTKGIGNIMGKSHPR